MNTPSITAILLAGLLAFLAIYGGLAISLLEGF